MHHKQGGVSLALESFYDCKVPCYLLSCGKVRTSMINCKRIRSLKSRIRIYDSLQKLA
jgi:hypothetical protein